MLISKLKTIQSIAKGYKSSQQKNTIKKKFSFGLLDKGVKNIDKFLNKKTVAYKLVLKVLLKKSFQHSVIVMSQTKIARLAGVCKKTVTRIIKELINDGLLAMNYLHRKVCSYMLSNIFKVEAVKRRLRYFFHAVTFLPVLLLFSINLKARLSEYVPPIKEEKKYISRNNKLPLKKSWGGSKKSFNWSRIMDVKDNVLGEIAKITRMKLSKRGIVELMKFPASAIAYANTQLGMASNNVRNPFSWFCKIASQFTRDNELPMNLELRKAALRASKFSLEEPMLETNELVPLEKKIQKNSNQNGMYSEYQHVEPELKPLEDELRVFEDYLRTPEAQKAKALGILQIPPRLKEHYLENTPTTFLADKQYEQEKVIIDVPAIE